MADVTIPMDAVFTTPSSGSAPVGGGGPSLWQRMWKEHGVRYLLCIVLPPLAVFSTGRWVQGILNIVLTILGWIPGVVHAALVVHDFYDERRANRIIDAVRAARVTG